MTLPPLSPTQDRKGGLFSPPTELRNNITQMLSLLSSELVNKILSHLSSQTRGGESIHAAASCSRAMLQAAMLVNVHTPEAAMHEQKQQQLWLTVSPRNGILKLPQFICSRQHDHQQQYAVPSVGLRLFSYQFPAGDLAAELMGDNVQRQCLVQRLAMTALQPASGGGLTNVGSLLLRMPALKHLALDASNWGNTICCTSLAAALPSLSALTSLRLDLRKSCVVGLDALAEALLHHMPHLEDLRLGSSVGFAALVGTSSALRGLTLFGLEYDPEAESLCTLLDGCAGQLLHLSFKDVGDVWPRERMHILFASIGKMQRLETLELHAWFGTMADEDSDFEEDARADGVPLGACLRCLTTLKRLTLSNMNVYAVSEAVPAFSVLSALKELHVYEEIDPDSLVKLMTGMQHSRCSLTRLILHDIDTDSISVGVGSRLAALLSRMPDLQDLQLEGGLFGSASSTAFMTEFVLEAATVGSRLPHLQSLILSHAVALPLLMAAMENMRSLQSAQAHRVIIGDGVWAQRCPTPASACNAADRVPLAPWWTRPHSPAPRCSVT